MRSVGHAECQNISVRRDGCWQRLWGDGRCYFCNVGKGWDGRLFDGGLEELFDGFGNCCSRLLHIVQNMLYFFRGQTVAFELGNGFERFFEVDKFVIIFGVERIVPVHAFENFL